MLPNRQQLQEKATFFEIRLNSLPHKYPIPCDVYLTVNSKPTLLRKRGDSLTSDRVESLTSRGANTLLVPSDQRDLYLNGLRGLFRDAGVDTATKGKLIKESAFAQMQELFKNPNVPGVVEATESLVQDMVIFLAAGSAAASSLLKISDHDVYTFNHSVNVAVYAILLAKRLNGIDPKSFVTTGVAALLHDIGKKDLSIELVKKTAPLSKVERDILRRHPTLGYRAVETVTMITQPIKEVILQHHENFDGSGYPNGLAGEKISRIARIISIADTFDALTTPRAGQPPVKPDFALSLMASLQPGRFDPGLFQNFNSVHAGKISVTLTSDFNPCSPAPFTLVNK